MVVVKENRTDVLAKRYRDVLAFVTARSRSREEAEEITQETFASLAATLRRSKDTAPPTLALLYTVAHRRVIDNIRSRSGLRLVSLDQIPEPAVSDVYGDEVAETLTRGLGDLGETSRQIVARRLLHGQSFDEIAEVVELTPEACRMRFMRALRELRNRFEEEGLTP